MFRHLLPWKRKLSQSTEVEEHENLEMSSDDDLGLDLLCSGVDPVIECYFHSPAMYWLFADKDETQHSCCPWSGRPSQFDMDRREWDLMAENPAPFGHTQCEDLHLWL